jgi:hypothetical protein
MPANSLDALVVNKLDKEHIRKGKKVAVLWAPMSVAFPTKITTGGTPAGTPVTLAELTGFFGVGLLRKDDAVTHSRDQERSTVEAVGFQDPVREDIDKDTHSFSMVPLQTFRKTIELYHGVDLSSYTLDAATGELSFPQPTDGVVTQGRWLTLAQDGIGLDRIWWGRGFTAGVVSETDDQSMGGEDPWTYPMTVSSQTDTDLGYGVHHFFGGPGWQSRAESLGFAAA